MGHGAQVRPADREPQSAVIALRPLAPADLAAISEIHCRACRIAYRFMGWAFTEAQVRDGYAGKLAQWDWGRAAASAARC
jgi:hypothetical protein